MSNNKINLLIEAGPAVDTKKSGVGNYVSDFLDSLSKYNNNQFNLFAYFFDFLGRNKKHINSNNIINKPIKYTPGKLISVFKLIGKRPYLELLLRNRFEFIIYTNYVSLPTSNNTPSALVVYDLGFIDCPEYVQDNNLKYLQKFCTKSIVESDLIITISEFTKERIEKEFPSTKNKIVITHIPPRKINVINTNLNKRLTGLGVLNNKYILYLGTLEPRKNLVNLIKAYHALPQSVKDEYGLVLAGGSGWKDAEIVNTIQKAKDDKLNIITPGYISEDEKQALYSNASLFVLPSHYEGFGMPILEAMQYNIPLAISDIPVFHEVAGNTAVYFNKDDPTDISNKLNKLISDKSLQKKLKSAYHEQLAKFSWNKNAKLVLGAIEQILEENHENH